MYELWREALRELPKAHLHIHFEGAVDFSLYSQWGGDKVAPSGTRDFDDFLACYKDVTTLIGQKVTNLRDAVCDVLAKEKSNGVRWVEITLDPFLYMPACKDPAEMLELLNLTIQPVADLYDIGVGYIIAIDRTASLSQAELSLGLAVSNQHHNVVALGIASNEQAGPLKQFSSIVTSRPGSLPFVPHAGELLGPDEVTYAIEHLGAHRIGHGTTLGDDKVLLRDIAASGVSIEACVGSNDFLNIVKYSSHPLPHWLEAGMCVSINADDPGLMSFTILDEYVNVQKEFSLSCATMADLARNSWHGALCTDEIKLRALRDIDIWQLSWEPRLPPTLK